MYWYWWWWCWHSTGSLHGLLRILMCPVLRLEVPPWCASEVIQEGLPFSFPLGRSISLHLAPRVLCEHRIDLLRQSRSVQRMTWRILRIRPGGLWCWKRWYRVNHRNQRSFQLQISASCTVPWWPLWSCPSVRHERKCHVGLLHKGTKSCGIETRWGIDANCSRLKVSNSPRGWRRAVRKTTSRYSYRPCESWCRIFWRRRERCLARSWA